MKKLIVSMGVALLLLTSNVLGDSWVKTVIVGVTKLVKSGSNYRKTALESSPKTKGGWVTDPYSGRKCRKRDAHADHIWPKSKGGTNYSWNLVMSCAEDNIRKSDKIGIETVYGYMAKLRQALD